MKYGCCVNMLATPDDPLGFGNIPVLKALGYDYAELPLAQLMELTDEQQHQVRVALDESNLPCRACNNFYPAYLRLTGPAVDAAAVETYTRKALALAARLGAQYVVFGSSGAKNVPEGFPMDQALEQIVQTLQMAGDVAKTHSITIAIEPLNHTESNCIITLQDGLDLMQRVNHPQVRMLVDYYHFALEGEPNSLLLQAGDAIVHMHLAQLAGREIPLTPQPELCDFLQTVQAAGYNGGISLEGFAGIKSPEAALAAALDWLRELETAG